MRRVDKAVPEAIQHKIVVVAHLVSQLFIRLVDSRADARGIPKVKRSSFHGLKSSGWSHRDINGRVAIRVDSHLVIENIARYAGQVEVGMLWQVNGRGSG